MFSLWSENFSYNTLLNAYSVIPWECLWSCDLKTLAITKCLFTRTVKVLQIPGSFISSILITILINRVWLQATNEPNVGSSSIHSATCFHLPGQAFLQLVTSSSEQLQTLGRWCPFFSPSFCLKKKKKEINQIGSSFTKLLELFHRQSGRWHAQATIGQGCIQNSK